LETTVTTTDLYEAVYYYLNSCELIEITGVKVNGKVACELTFARSNIGELQVGYLQGKAEVNLLEFRRAFGHINAWVHTAKKKFKNRLKNEALKRPQILEGGAS
jgi:hypothetical protein